ncbi:hypothetical protein [Algoriphagus aquimarinus]|uniref:hypothetical protein n=1 Tax=Algoriphagus aquimarinus TaxID=237018 RepID=UPI0030DB1D1F|tara:strand:- start:78096 stop:78599 length:504 start_codon:yes stop_codon:yes gene_type:complete
MKTLKNVIVISALFFSFFSCNLEDESFFQVKYTIEDLVKIDAGDSKSWSIQGYYSNYNQGVMKEDSPCYVDDIFTFQKGSTEITVIPGEVSCYMGDSKEEITTASYEFYEEEGLVFLSISKAVQVNGVTKNTFFSLQLVELSNDHMIFSSGEKGNYEVAIVLIASNN